MQQTKYYSKTYFYFQTCLFTSNLLESDGFNLIEEI